MDLERIKQNFRIRSGRARKPKKHPKVNGAPVPTKDSTQKSDQLPNGTLSNSTPQTPDKSSPASKPAETQSDSSPTSEKTQDTTPEKQKGQGEEQISEDIDEHSDPATDSPYPNATDSTSHHSRSSSLDSRGSSLAQETDKPPHTMADQQIPSNGTSSDAEDFDLSPPNPPKPPSKSPSVEVLAELLFSAGHLDAILQYPPQLARFSAFLQKYSPSHYPLLTQYLETRKAVKAIEYANAVAEGLKPTETGADHSTDTINQAAKLDSHFEAICNSSFDALVGDALCSYVSYSLVKVASECMTNEITGRSTPVMRDLVDGLSEVFCLTDPNREDNPIIYASEEFYRLTRYGPDDVLNNNCRFLQGRKTNPLSPKRLKRAIETGEELSETLLNYRRDGKPFINLLMIAPLHDKDGEVKYHIGAQIDVSGLVQGGKALEGFERYLARRNVDKRREEADGNLDDDQRRKKRALRRLRDLSETFDLEETAVVQAVSRSNSLTRDDDDNGSLTTPERQKAHRRVYVDSDSSDYGDDDDDEERKKDDADWKLGDAGNGRLSGKLPGVYDSFMLFRSAPSLRLVFISPKLRKFRGALHAPFLSHVAAPTGTLNGLAESLKSGVPVSAKVHFMPERGERREGTRLTSGSKHEDGKNGRAIWVSCTPLVGADDRIGVWMCVVVEKSKVGSIIRKPEAGAVGLAEGSTKAERSEKAEESVTTKDKKSPTGSEANGVKREDAPIKPVRVDSDTVIKTQAEKSPESADAGQDQTSKTVRPQQSIYFDAEQGADLDTQETSDHRDPSIPASSEGDTVTGNHSPTGSSTQERDPRSVVTPVQEYDATERAVLTPVQEYESPRRKPKSYSVEIPGITSVPDYGDDSNDEYITTRSPVTPSRQAAGRVLIEEDSDNLQDSDVDHQRDNMKIGRRRVGSSSPASMNSPASDIPPSVPSSAMIADDGDESSEYEDEEEVEDNSKRKVTSEDTVEDAGGGGNEADDKLEDDGKAEVKVEGQDQGQGHKQEQDHEEERVQKQEQEQEETLVQKQSQDQEQEQVKEEEQTQEPEPGPEAQQEQEQAQAHKEEEDQEQKQQHVQEPEQEQAKKQTQESEADQRQEEDQPQDQDQAKGQEQDEDEDLDADLTTPTGARHNRSPTPPDAPNEDKENNDYDLSLEKSHATIKPATKDTSPTRGSDHDSDHDSAISLDSPAQPRKQKSRSRTPHSQSPSQKSEYDDKESKTPRYIGEVDELDELQARERDEFWVKEGRPPTSRTNSDNKIVAGHSHSHTHQDHDHDHCDDPDHDHGESHNNTRTANTGHSAPGIRLDYLGAGNKRWAARASRQPRRRLDTNFGDYEAVVSGVVDDENSEATRSDHCATSPYSVD